MRRGNRLTSLAAVVLVAAAAAGCSGDQDSVLGEPDETTASAEPTDESSDQPTDTEPPSTTDEPTPTDPPETSEPPEAVGSLLVAPVRRQLPVPDDPCRSEPARDRYCSTDGTARYLLAPRLVPAGVLEAQVAQSDEVDSWVVNVQLDDRGTRTFAHVTRRLAGTDTQLAVVVADRVVTAAGITAPITEGVVAIYGGLDRREAQALARRLS